MNKKLIVFVILALAVVSLSSCRSKKNSCTKAEVQEQVIEKQEIA